MLPFALLPESCILDILFRHGGFRPMGSVLHNVARAFPNTKWAELLEAFLVVSRLRHPAEGIYLLANGCVTPSKPAIVQAIRLLLPSSPFVVNEWLDRPDIPNDYEGFAHEYAANERFTAEWHAAHGDHMGETILAKAAEEIDRLEPVLYDQERQRMVSVRRPRFRLSFADEQAVIFEAQHQADVHRRVLHEAADAIDSLPVALLDLEFQHVASLVSALFDQYPALTWSLKLCLHRAAIDKLGLGVWHIERELLRRERAVQCPLHALRHLGN